MAHLGIVQKANCPRKKVPVPHPCRLVSLRKQVQVISHSARGTCYDVGTN